MIKRILFLILFSPFLFSLKTDAQWVTIPDANFVTFLQQNFPGCMNGNQMDTTCSTIVTTTYVNCSNKNIQNLNGIQYFDGLINLYCYTNQLTTLPVLHSNLTHLSCSQNQITSLPALPSTLKVLICETNQLTTLPALPPTLDSLFASVNQIATLPSIPSTVIHLDCNSNPLTMLPALSTNLYYLGCGGIQLTSLPVALPPNLVYLHCGFSQLTSLPVLPSTLQYLMCPVSHLTSLPVLPNSLTTMNVAFNQLTSLPALPQSLTNITASYNQLTSLPVLPSAIFALWCDNNQISCLPYLPNTLVDTIALKLKPGNSFTCLPNYVPAMNGTALLSYPICIPGNPNNCPSFTGMDEVEDNSQLAVFPNPGNGIYSVNFRNHNSSYKTMEVFNTVGKQILIAKNFSNSAVLDLSAQPDGIYFLHFTDGNNSITQKIVKQ